MSEEVTCSVHRGHALTLRGHTLTLRGHTLTLRGAYQKLLHNLLFGLVDQRGILHCEGREPYDAQQTCVHLFGTGLPGKEGLQLGLGKRQMVLGVQRYMG